MGNCTSGVQESSERPKGGIGNGADGPEPITVQPFNIAPQDLRASIGQKGAKIGITDAIAGANPFYNGGAQGDFSENCQRAVIAYEMRRRGYDVVALPTYAGDKLPSGGRWKGAFQHAKEVHVGASTPQQTQANLEREMRSYGRGSRAIVRIPGHVFNVENVNGKIRYVDAQTNTVYNSNNVFKRLGKQAATVSIVRTDNLRISERAKKSVTPTTDTVRMIVERRNGR